MAHKGISDLLVAETLPARREWIPWLGSEGSGQKSSISGTWGPGGDVCVVPSTLLLTGAVVPSQQHLWVWSLLAKQGLVEQFGAV